MTVMLHPSPREAWKALLEADAAVRAAGPREYAAADLAGHPGHLVGEVAQLGEVFLELVGRIHAHDDVRCIEPGPTLDRKVCELLARIVRWLPIESQL